MDNGSLDSQYTDSQYVRNLGVEDYAVLQSSQALGLYYTYLDSIWLYSQT